MPLILETPVKLVLPAEWTGSSVETSLRAELGYQDGSALHEYRTWKSVQRSDDYKPDQHWFVKKHGREALDEKVDALALLVEKTALFTDKSGRLYTYSGLAPRLAEKYNQKIVRNYEMPAHKFVAYENQPFESRWYQQEAEDLLVPAGHGAVEFATGLGKSLIICKLCKRIGLPAVVIAPTLSIATQLLADMRRLFGKGKVGQFFDGKKEADKYFVVAVSKSLTLLERGSPLAKALAKKSVLIGDESHLLPAETLSRVILGLLSAVPYRFFLSGTQLRGDGLDIVLEGITGAILMRMDVRQGVEEEVLAQPKFFQVPIRSNLNLDIPDVIKMNRTHLHQNEEVYKHAAAMVNKAFKNGLRPLVLVEEISQFTMLLPFLNPALSVGFAHGGVDKKSKNKLPEAFHKSDPMELVRKFDAAEIDILVGTSCIAIGTDIKTADFMIDLVGLASEVRLRQAVGRGTRRGNGKKSFIFIDYDIWNIPKLSKHAEKRRKVLDSIYGPVTVLKRHI